MRKANDIFKGLSKTMVKNVVEKFKISGEFVSAERYGNGHINDTYLVILKTGETERKYILQKINKNVFKSPEKLMKNFGKKLLTLGHPLW